MRIGLEDPQDFSKVLGVVTLAEGSLCGSAGNRRAWDRFHHIMDPHTLESVKDVVATWVVDKNAIRADALATALFFVPPKALLRHFDFDYLVFYPDRTITISPGFPAEMFLKS